MNAVEKTAEPTRVSYVEHFKAKYAKLAVVGDDTHLNLAHAIVYAAHVHQSSFDKAGCDAESERNDAENKRREFAANKLGAEIKLSDRVWTFHEKYQLLNIHEACEVALPAELVQPVYLLLALGWNDALGWAEELVGNEWFDKHEG